MLYGMQKNVIEGYDLNRGLSTIWTRQDRGVKEQQTVSWQQEVM